MSKPTANHVEHQSARGGDLVSTATAPTLREPVSPHNAVLLLVDQQEGLFSRVHEPQQTRRTLLALTRCARLLGIPAVMTTALAAGPNGPQLEELTETFAGQEIIDRTLINAWRDDRVRDAITRTGRSKLIIAGTGLDVCAQLPALASTADGYDAYVVLDGCGRFEPEPSVATVSRLTQAGGDPIGAPTGSAVAKAGVVRFTQEVDRAGARHGVRVNWASPSTILTERAESVIPAERRAQLAAMHSAGRLGTPEDVACAGPVPGFRVLILDHRRHSSVARGQIMRRSGFPVGGPQRTEAMPCSSSWPSS
jgi:NAD(P)-dependent dehydrogenase (short-subunit alcohol dehydrogenase family)